MTANMCKGTRLLPTFDDPDSAFPARQGEALAVGADRATATPSVANSPRANAQNKRKAIIECRQDPASYGEVWWQTSPHDVGHIAIIRVARNPAVSLRSM